MQYTYHINLDERGSFEADVRNAFDKTVFEISGNEIFEEGFMKNKADVTGLTAYLKSIGILQPGDTLTAELAVGGHAAPADDTVAARKNKLKDYFENENTEYDWDDILKPGDVIYGDGLGDTMLITGTTFTKQGDYFELTDKFGRTYSHLIIPLIRKLHAKDIYLSKIGIPKESFVYPENIRQLNSDINYKKGSLSLYNKNPLDAENHHGITYAEVQNAKAEIPALEKQLRAEITEYENNRRKAMGGTFDTGYEQNPEYIALKNEYEQIKSRIPEKGNPVLEAMAEKKRTQMKRIALGSSYRHFEDGGMVLGKILQAVAGYRPPFAFHKKSMVNIQNPEGKVWGMKYTPNLDVLAKFRKDRAFEQQLIDDFKSHCQNVIGTQLHAIYTVTEKTPDIVFQIQTLS